jgi:hypothetical protein
MNDNYDRTPEGKQVIALLEQAAPPVPDVHARAHEILAALPEAERPGRRLAPLVSMYAGVAAAAAALVLTVLIVVLPGEPEPGPHVAEQPPTLEHSPPDARPSLPMAAPYAPPELVTTVRSRSAEGWRVDAGLSHGLRAGDQLTGPEGRTVRVLAVGIFDARVADADWLRLGTRLVLPDASGPYLRVLAYRQAGGDPGSLFDLGAVFQPASTLEARAAGISSGRALGVIEVIPAILRDHNSDAQPSLAARAGLRRGDIVLEVNGHGVSDIAELVEALRWTRNSGILQVTVLREGQALQLRTQ